MKRLGYFLSFFLLCYGFSGIVSYATEPEQLFVLEENEEEPSQAKDLNFSLLFFKTILLLGALITLLLSGSWFLKRMLGGRFAPEQNQQSVRLIERSYLSPKTSLWLVEIKDHPFVVVDSQHGVTIHPIAKERKE